MDKNRQLLKRIFAEVVALTTVLVASLAVLGHIASTAWLKIFLYDGDSLTLPILRQSLHRHEVVQWVFSSQLNLFPEGVLYAISCLFSASTGVTLAVNAVINVLLLYALIRCIAGVTITDVRYRQAYGVLCVILLLGCMILEVPTYPIVGQGFVAYFLFNTYYSGMLLVGILNIFIVLRQLKVGRYDVGTLWLTVTVGLITALAVASNPLYAVQFAVPIVLSVSVLALCNLLKRKQAALLIAIQAVCVGLGMSLRLFLRPFIGQSLNSHLRGSFDITNLKDSFFGLINILIPYNASAATRLSILFVLLGYFACLIAALLILNHQHKTGRLALSRQQLSLLLLISITPIVIALFLATGNDVTQRYFIEPAVLLFLSPLVLIGQYGARIYKPTLYALAALCVVFAILMSVQWSHLRLYAHDINPDVSCLQSAVDGQGTNGVGDYSLSRFLDVYNTQGIRVLQTHGSFDVYPWLNNLATYQHKQFSFVVEENTVAQQQVFANQRALLTGSPQLLGTASYVRSCPSFTVYGYKPGTNGYMKLNKKIDTSLARAEQERQEGNPATYNGFNK